MRAEICITSETINIQYVAHRHQDKTNAGSSETDAY